MSHRSWFVATAALVFGVLLNAGALALLVADGQHGSTYLIWTFVIFTGPFLILGALVVAHLPSNAVGWLLLLVGFSQSMNAATGAYADHAAGALPLARLIDAFAEVNWLPSLAIMVTLLPSLFPTGRPLSPRWRWPVWLAASCMILIVTFGTLAGWFEQRDPVTNEPASVAPAAVGLPLLIGFALLAPTTLLSISSAIVRFRRSRGTERQQLKWFAFAVVVCLAIVIYQFVPAPIGDDTRAMVSTIGFIALPASIAIAILRYRLYDIDRLINRALVYGLLSASLIGIYVVFVVTLQTFLDPLTSGSDLTVAASTLAVAALFRPVRARIQHVVDRRFYRHKYDAARTVDAFVMRLREQIDLDAITQELRGVVRETMQPSHVSLWLPAAPREIYGNRHSS